MDSDMVEIAPPAFAWCSKTLEIHKGFSGDECFSALVFMEVWKLILLRLDPVCNLFSSWLQLLSWLRQGSAAAPKTMRTVVAQAAIFSSMASTQQTQQRSSQPRVNKGHKFV
ncbi:BnaA09g40410D [Brassica napus]|uniref:BnaA09g40410D protein n=2 Tax=Brassica TaxID=3705 RepID=A0A078FAR6_BRANA|nr:BnaA09g40410D [Brassica napus]VDC63308.1 unnamed protein product [Brassica rapa]